MLLSACLLALFLGVAPAALGDWDPGDPNKMHFPQYPDPWGWDICVNCQWVADDFACSEDGPITDIHFWISWLYDDVNAANIQSWDVSIWSDATGGPGACQMQPGSRLWTWQGDGNIQIRWEPVDGLQGWHCPNSVWSDPCNHGSFYQVNITNIQEVFTQVAGTTYWLVIKVYLVRDMEVPGWKTSTDAWRCRALWSLGPDSGLAWKLVDSGTPETGDPRYHDMAFVITGVEEAEVDHGDAPDGDPVNPAIAYPSLGIPGAFPTCRTILGSGYIEHGLGWARFEPPMAGAPGWDAEVDGDAGLCPPPGCFPTYDDDECFADMDAGLLLPDAYTIDNTPNVVPCPAAMGTALGYVCNNAVWGQDVDIYVNNTMPVDGWVNVLADWQQDGVWGGSAPCPGAAAPEYILQDFGVPSGYAGALSGLMPFPTSFLIGPNSGYVWFRFTITERKINNPSWDGRGSFEDGETEDYLLRVDACQPPADDNDFGDAPQPYPTLLANNGARHTIAVAMYLGNGVDGEPDGQPEPAAMGDDLNLLYPGIAYPPGDEDGVVFTSPLMPGSWATVDVWVSAVGRLNAWVDFGGDGSWAQAVDQIFTDVALDPINPNPQSLTFFVPFGAQVGPTFARFRYGTQLGLSYDGAATDGEVEDYEVDIEENPAIKWIQFPDKSPNGIDIKVTGQWLADDFECTTYGPITDVHLWCSWKYDDWGELANVHLSFHTDDPCGPGGSDPCNLYSKPDELKWERDFGPGEFDLQPVATLSEPEWWWDPQRDDLIPGGDLTLWRLDVYINPDEAFIQEGDPCNPVIYWLDVRVDVESEFKELGWKTRRYPEQFADDAVFHWGELPFDWKELRYPDLHPHHPNSIDMAFALTGEEWFPPKEPVPNLKWSQPPIEIDPMLSRTPEYCGWDQESLTSDPCTYWMAVADDFRCLGTMPITSVHWYGSHIGWGEPCLPPIVPSAWRIGFWSNIPAGSGTDPDYSRPEVLLWQVEVPANRVEWEYIGNDWFPFPDMVLPEACFQYYVKFEPNEWFWQSHYELDTQDNIFWISIAAIYPTEVAWPWGWKTRPWPWMDDAVTFEHWGPLDPGVAVDPDVVVPIENALVCSEPNSYDVAFELDTDPCYIKWEQPFTGIRHWRHYEDIVSMAIDQPFTEYKWWQEPDPLGWDVCLYYRLADDWQCDETGWIDDIHFWISSQYDDPFQILSIDVEIYSDNPSGPQGHSEPNELLWLRSFSSTEFEIVADGRGDQGWLEPDHSHWYRPDHNDYYLVNIDHIPDPHFQIEGTIYWLSIQLQMEGHVGWKTSINHWNDDAVYDDGTGRWQDMTDPETGETIDLAFALTTQKDYDLRAQVADDWRCDSNTPVTAVVWWGSYLGYDYEACVCPQLPRPVKPDYFQLTIWDDVPADTCDLSSFSHPNNVIWEYKTRDYDEVLVGYDKYPHGSPREPVFRYSVRVPKEAWFFQEDVNTVYWLGVLAVWDANWPTYEWGWTNHEYFYNDDAVSGKLVLDASGSVSRRWTEIFDQTGESADMSFILFTEPDCLSITAPGYARWVGYGKPDCWCYRKQCRGDADGQVLGGVFPVSLDDVIMVRAALNLPDALIQPGDECADFDHALLGGVFPVSLNDVAIVRLYLNRLDAMVPQCDQAPVITGPYNFWTSP
jgi:hypothetical protein